MHIMSDSDHSREYREIEKIQGPSMELDHAAGILDSFSEAVTAVVAAMAQSLFSRLAPAWAQRNIRN